MDRHEDPAPTRSQPKPLDQVRGVIRRLHYSIRTELALVDWIRRFILFHEGGIRQRWVRPRWRRF